MGGDLGINPWIDFGLPEKATETYLIFLRETLPKKGLADGFGVPENALSVAYVDEGRALGGQVFWMKLKAGEKVKPSALSNPCWTIRSLSAGLQSVSPMFLDPQAQVAKACLDTLWDPPRPSFSPLSSQVDVEKRCAYLPMFGEFEWDDCDYAKVDDKDQIEIRGSWKDENILPARVPQLNGIPVDPLHYSKGGVQFNKVAVKQLQGLWAAWERAGLLSHIKQWGGGFMPRYMRTKPPHRHKTLSNHAWGTAFDINVQQNLLGQEPARLGEYGCVRELVAVAHRFGFYWGGHFTKGKSGKDGMHFEIARLM